MIAIEASQVNGTTLSFPVYGPFMSRNRVPYYMAQCGFHLERENEFVVFQHYGPDEPTNIWIRGSDADIPYAFAMAILDAVEAGA